MGQPPQVEHVYDDQVASHYAAFRPPLHEMILKRALGAGRFNVALDVGCGTGRSSVALADYCGQVIGCDVNAAMISAATPHPQVTYVEGGLEALTRPAGGADLVSFAGVLPYLDASQTLAALHQLCRKDAHILTYDFEVHVNPVMQALGCAADAEGSAYDHSANLLGHLGIEPVAQERQEVNVPMTGTQAAHVLLSSAARYQHLCDRFGTDQPLARVSAALGDTADMTADIYFTLHRLVADPAHKAE